jgi:hypothetical protein
MAVECFGRWRFMVKVGFICEGTTESILLQSESFKHLPTSLNIESLRVINAEGSGNLLPHNIGEYVTILEKEGTEAIIILTDLDEDICITQTKERISARKQDIVVIAVKKIEAWFLACGPAMWHLLKQPDFHFATPENVIDPFETTNSFMVEASGRGIGKKSAGKIKLVTKLLEAGLDLSQAADHPGCPSVKYFIDKLIQIGSVEDQ